MTIFGDTSALVALFRTDDSNHKKAKELSKKLEDKSGIISNYIFAETVTVLSQKIGKQLTIIAAQTIRQIFKEIRIDQDIDELAWEIFKKQKSKNVSLVDCTTIALFQKGIFDQLFTFDTDFKNNKVAILE